MVEFTRLAVQFMRNRVELQPTMTSPPQLRNVTKDAFVRMAQFNMTASAFALTNVPVRCEAKHLKPAVK